MLRTFCAYNTITSLRTKKKRALHAFHRRGLGLKGGGLAENVLCFVVSPSLVRNISWTTNSQPLVHRMGSGHSTLLRTTERRDQTIDAALGVVQTSLGALGSAADLLPVAGVGTAVSILQLLFQQIQVPV